MTATILFKENEGSTTDLNIKFYDKLGALVVPDSATWVINDLASGTVMKASAALPAGSSVDVTIPATANAIVSQANTSEIRVITVHAVEGTDVKNDDYHYMLMNLHFIP
jgi:hypothetical protein